MSNAFETEWDTPEYDTLASLAGDLVFRLPGCTDVMVRKTLASVYRDFCKRTCVLQTKRKITLEYGENSYKVSPILRDCIIDCITEGKLDGHPIRLMFNGDIIFMDDMLLPNEGETRELEVTAIEVPCIGSESVPRSILQHYGDALVSGVLYKLFSMTNRAWSDPNQAMLEAKLYENALTECRARYYSGGNLANGELNYMKKGLVL